MSATGGGGTQSVSLVNAANSSTFCLMVVTGLLTPTFIHLTNIRWVLVFGTMGYAPYAASLYTHQKYGTDWFVVFGAVCCGISAGCFWATEGAVILSYPERENQGKYLSYWLMYRVLGQAVGGAINLGLNVSNNHAGSLSTNTYLVFVVLQCLGPFVALLLSLPHQVQRSDGTPVLLNLNPNVKSELLAMVKILKTKKVLLLLPLIWQGTFSEALIGTYAADNFTVRSRALGSLLSAIVAALACYILGFFLDNQRWSINRRGVSAYISIYAMQLAWWAWAIYTMNKYHKIKPTLDFGESEWSRGFAVYIFLQIGFNLMCEC
jgi:MFS family permease